MKKPITWLIWILIFLVLLISSCDLLPPVGDDPEPGNTDSSTASTNLGRGYNIFGNYADAKEVRGEVLDYDRLETDGLTESRTIETSNFQAFTGSTISEYSSQMATSVGISGGFKAFSGSVKTNFSSDTSSRAEYSYATIQSQVYKSELSIKNPRVEELRVYLTPQAREDINNGELDPTTLFASYGTHVIHSLYTGGRLDYNMAFDMSKIVNTRSLSVMASASFDAKFASAGISTEHLSSEERSNFESHTQRTLNVYGGSSEFGQNIINDNDYRRWIESIQDHSQFVGFPKSEQEGGGGLIGIWEFAEDEERQSAIEAAFVTLAEQQGLDINNSLTVEVILRRIYLVKTDDAGGAAELYGHLGFDGYKAEEDLAFYGGFQWSLGESDADDWGEVAPGAWINIENKMTRTFQDFDESRAFIGLWGHIWEDDISGDEDLGDRWAHVYMRHGWNGATEHKLYFNNAGTEAQAIFTIGIVNQ